MPEHLRILGAALDDELTDDDMVVAANAAYEALEARGVDLKGVAPVLRDDDPGVGFDLGTLSVARVLGGPTATLALKGDDGAGRVDVPQEAIEPLARTLEDLRSVYDPNDPAPLVGDGGAKCGRRTCEEPLAVSFLNQYGAIRQRCEVHALADGVDGIGESRAETIVEEIGLEELVDLCEGKDSSHSPPALSRIDGLGPTSAASIAAAVDESNVADEIRDEPEAATDGGAVLDVDDLDRAAAALSGRYGLDFMQSQRPGSIELSATLARLKDVKDDLEDGADSIEVIEHDDAGDPSAGTLFLEPGDEQLEELLEIEREARPDGGGSGE